MTSLFLPLVLLSTVLAAVGAVIVKTGAVRITKSIWSLIWNFRLILGVVVYLAGFLLYVVALQWGPVSVAYPLSSLSHLWVAVMSHYLLQEKQNKLFWVGLVLLLVGVVLTVS